jgi:hypothetical protein
MAILTKTCGRCGGRGHYSFNLVHGTVCFGCGGKGIVPANPGKKGVKPTSLYDYAHEGDIAKYSGYGVCVVLAVDEGEFKSRDGMTYPQRVVLESLIDGKVSKTLRHRHLTEKMLWGKMHKVNRLTNVWSAIED